LTPDDLLATAQRLIDGSGKRRPRQSDLARAQSTIYYALFNALCLCCADCFVGGRAAERSEPAWRQVFRSVSHGYAKSQFRSDRMRLFPAGIRNFGNCFVTQQEARHSADYDPSHRCNRSDVQSQLAIARSVIQGLRRANLKDRRALSVWVLLKDR
jgi:hypothetical protein